MNSIVLYKLKTYEIEKIQKYVKEDFSILVAHSLEELHNLQHKEALRLIVTRKIWKNEVDSDLNIVIFEDLMIQISRTAERHFFEYYEYFYLTWCLDENRKKKNNSIIVGASSARFGVEESIIKGGCINFALPSQDIYYSCKIARKAIEENPNVNKLYFGLDICSFYSDLSRQGSAENDRIRTTYYPLIKDKHHLEHVEEKNNRMINDEYFDLSSMVDEKSLSFKDRFAYGFFIKERSRKWCSLKINQKLWTDCDKEEQEIAAKNRALNHNKYKKYQESFNENIQIFQEFVIFCNEKNVRLILTVFPGSEYYQKYIDYTFYDEMMSVLNETEGILELVDLVSENPYEKDDFVDMDHLNIRGAIKTSHILNSIEKEDAIEKDIELPVVKITFQMYAYNAEKFIRSAIDSVLYQTEKDIRLVIRNNASTDNNATRDICLEYARKDPRIQYVENEKPYLLENGITHEKLDFMPEIRSEYVSKIDHDDVLDKDFAKTMYTQARENDADICICGCYFFDDKTKNILGRRKTENYHVSRMSEIGSGLSNIYGALRPIWGKIFKSTFWNDYYEWSRVRPKELRLSIDTYMIMKMMSVCKNFVSVDEPLYWYRMSSASQFNSKKMETYRINEADYLYEIGNSFIIESNLDNDINKEFLWNVHWGHMIDLLSLLEKSENMSVEEILHFMEAIFKNKFVKRYASNSENAISTPLFGVMKSIENRRNIKLDMESSYLVKYYYVICEHPENEKELIESILLDDANESDLGITRYNELIRMNLRQEYCREMEKK